MAETPRRGKANPDTFGRRLAGRRVQLGWRQKELAERIGMSSTTVVNWENGKAQPRGDRLVRLAGVLGVDSAWLMGSGEDGPTRDAA